MSEQKFIIENGVLIKYKGADENVIIPEGVKAIGDNAFYEKETIKSIIIPDGVKAIGNAVFYGCENLKKITI